MLLSSRSAPHGLERAGENSVPDRLGPDCLALEDMSPKLRAGNQNPKWPSHFLPITLRLPFLGSDPRSPLPAKTPIHWHPELLEWPPGFSGPTPILPLPTTSRCLGPAGLVPSWPLPGFERPKPRMSDLRNAGTSQRQLETPSRRDGVLLV